ncbi:MAG TPA: enoyl-CoA hydratase-related protein [Acidimicrobiales bacterium]|nr:enoyl-CoA hydratase-related protein [Acidimicrobiales bacterium]
MSAAPRDEQRPSRKSVRLRRSGAVAELRLDRPAAHNALSSAMLGELRAACVKLAGDPALAAVVLSSTDPVAFCVGADLKERAGFSDDELVAQRPLLSAAFAALRAIPVPVVAAVGGYAVGGGYELALSCDVIVAGEGAVVGLPEVSRGLIPGGGGTQLLQRRAGSGVAAELIYSGRLVAAPEALQRGLVDRLVAGGSEQGEALALAGEIAGNSPLAVRSAKRALLLGADLALERGLEVEEAAWRRVALSEDRREGIRAFVEKRPPVWPPSVDAL